MTNETGKEKSRRRAAAWVKDRNWLASYFQDQADAGQTGYSALAPIKFWRHRIFLARATRARLYHERNGEGHCTTLRG
jgi:inorganic triphosphatase YgiF